MKTYTKYILKGLLLSGLFCGIKNNNMAQAQSSANPSDKAIESRQGREMDKMQTLENDTAFKPKIYTGNGGVLPYLTLTPREVKPGKKYPLFISLHGSGERGNDNRAQILWCKPFFLNHKNRDKYPCYVIAPQCPKEMRWSTAQIDKVAKKTSAFEEKPTEPMKNLMDLLAEVEKNYPIDRERIYITGNSMGGNGTWDLAIRMPSHFAAIAPVCGFIDTTQADKLVEMPAWVFHGEMDNVVPPECSRAMVNAIKKAGGRKIKYTEYPKVDHASWVQAYNEEKLFPWFFKQRLGR